jgi:hypothetical protein
MVRFVIIIRRLELGGGMEGASLGFILFPLAGYTLEKDISLLSYQAAHSQLGKSFCKRKLGCLSLFLFFLTLSDTIDLSGEGWAVLWCPRR